VISNEIIKVKLVLFTLLKDTKNKISFRIENKNIFLIAIIQEDKVRDKKTLWHSKNGYFPEPFLLHTLHKSFFFLIVDFQ
jgi:hypothetical protein